MNKEKKIIQIVVKIFIVLFIVGLIFGVIMGLKHKNREYYITDHEYLYDIAIYYLKEKENKERKGETVNYTEKHLLQIRKNIIFLLIMMDLV